MFARFRAPTAHSLDPFASMGDARSSIRGLGDDAASAASDIAFHTAYTSFDPGPLLVSFVFAAFTASRGTMLLHALAMPDDGATAEVQTTTLVNLAELAALAGRFRLPVIVKRGHAYAFVGRLLEPTDAHAAALTIQTGQSADGPAFAQKLAAAKQALFAARSVEHGLVVEASASLAHVRSQMCTAAQFDEADYDRWIGEMHRLKHRHRKQWEHVWICRVLETMGCLRDGARGLGFGCGVEPLPAVFARHGVFVTATDLGADDRRARRWQDTAQHLLSLDVLSKPAICPPDEFQRRVTVEAVDMNNVPASFNGYDFCWSSCSLEHLGSIDAGLRFIERSLATLAPGGVAAHTTEFNLTSNSRTIRKGGTVLFRRRDIETFARCMERDGHEVLPITWDQGDQPEDQIVDVAPYASDMHFKLALRSYVTTSFGLAIRKAR